MKFKFRRYYLYYLGRVIGSLLYILPLEVALYIAKVLGNLAFHTLARYRRIAIANLTFVFEKVKTKSEIYNIAVRVFENLGKNGVELVNFPKIRPDRLNKFIEIKNIGIVEHALQSGKGAILLTGHFGNWELVAGAFKSRGYHGAVIGRRIYFERYDNYLNRLRKSYGVDIIYRDESPKKILRVLKDNGIIGILADQDVDSVNGVFVNFFGAPAYTPSGPVALASLSGASLIPVFLVRRNGHHTLFVEEPVQLVKTENEAEDLVTNTQRWSDVVEAYIRRYPEQWVWMHRRWKTKKI